MEHIFNILNSNDLSIEEMRQELNYNGNLYSEIGVLLAYINLACPDKYPKLHDVLYYGYEDKQVKRVRII
jgi:hypothetical protein